MVQKNRISLPIDSHVPSILDAGRKHPTLLVRASPGSGKTTRLPWAMTQITEKKVIVLEPRRLAAKLAAERISEEENFTAGNEVGYHFRFDRKISDKTRLIFYTEGTFLKLLSGNPDLSDVGVVILDEFHERHIETDLAFAYLRALQEKRNDLLIIVMSATLDTSIAQVFKNPAVFDIEAPRFPVDIHYLPNQPSILTQPLETKIKNTLAGIKAGGDILIFVPGMREMLQVKERIGDSFGEVHLLHADLPKDEQDRALGKISGRKIILSTNIAESSVTIPGIRIVIDSGIQREAQFSPWTGLKILADKPITQSSAIQRTGRAGREAAGECWRLYAKQDFDEREAFTIPEIMRADLLDTVLLSRHFDCELKWPSPPPVERWKKAEELGKLLGLLSPDGELTKTGKDVERIPLDARLGRAFLASGKLSAEEQKKFIRSVANDIEGDRSGNLQRRLTPLLPPANGNDPWEKAILTGFVDQIARYRQKQNDFIHFSGKTLKAHRDLSELQYDFYLILDVTARGEAIQVIPVLEEWIMELEPFPFHEENVFDMEKLRKKTRTMLGSIVMDEAESPLNFSTLPSDSRKKFLELAETPFRKKIETLKSESRWGKLHFWGRMNGINLEEIDVSPSDFFANSTSWDDLSTFIFSFIEEKLGISNIERDLPSKIDLGGRRELPIHYPLNLDPYVEAPIQDFYGQKSVPALMQGKVPLQLKLLGPNRMPIQVTKDLANFWSKMYPEMRKVWLREYPRHHWAEDPTTAKPILLKRML
ncbi:MAG: ATP-dependent helicase C-terminal domain-containing protein [Bdellovibrionota bacterium]